MKAKKFIEILAPAGSVDGMKAAFAAGADACYIGGRLFGARAYADNPNEKELVEAVYYAHLRNKKLYLTVNTLLNEEEFPLLYDYILPYCEAGIDGIIVQDLGVLKFLYKNFDGIELHASTQVTVCDTGAVEILKKYGVTRIVLSRELSLSEIENFKNFDIEIECFVHGALCVCYSGQCLMSALNGKRSGNKGSCAGNCRLSYNLYEGGSNERRIASEPYLLSTKDICTLDLIPEMVETGINSFKIEGRMKRAEYAALTAFLYRKWTDVYLKNGKEYFNSKEIKKDRDNDILKLSDIYNRGSFTNGYLTSWNGSFMMSSVRPNHNGVFVGQVKSVRKNTMEIKAVKELNAQDVLEIRNENKPKEPVYEFTLKDAKKSGEIFDANFNRGLLVYSGLSVYRTKNEKLLSEIGERFIKKSEKIKIRAYFFAEIDKEISLTLNRDDISITVKGIVCQKALNKPLKEDRIMDSLLKLGDTDFFMKENDVEVQVIGDVFFPISSLNELRRVAIEELSKAIVSKWKKNVSVNGYKNKLAENEKKPETQSTTNVEKTYYAPEKPCKLSILISTSEQLNCVLDELKSCKNSEIIINLELFGRKNLLKMFERLSAPGVHFYLRLPEIFRRKTREIYDGFFSTNDGIEVLMAIEGFLLRNLEEITFVKGLSESISKNFKIIADTNLYTANSMAVEMLAELGIYRYTSPLEQDLNEVRLVKNALGVSSKLTLPVYGREELMVMTQCQWKNQGACVKELKKGHKQLADVLYIENKKKINGKIGKFPVIKNCETCTNYVYQGEPINFLHKKEEIKKLAPDYMRLDFTFENEKEVREVIKLANFSK